MVLQTTNKYNTDEPSDLHSNNNPHDNDQDMQSDEDSITCQSGDYCMNADVHCPLLLL